jgi:hypothetical protein
MAKRAAPKRLGELLVAEFTELRDTLRRREPIDQRFTVRAVELSLQGAGTPQASPDGLPPPRTDRRRSQPVDQTA